MKTDVQIKSTAKWIRGTLIISCTNRVYSLMKETIYLMTSNENANLSQLNLRLRQWVWFREVYCICSTEVNIVIISTWGRYDHAVVRRNSSNILNKLLLGYSGVKSFLWLLQPMWTLCNGILLISASLYLKVFNRVFNGNNIRKLSHILIF